MKPKIKIDIVDIIAKYVRLRKLGPGYTGVCPFCGADEVTGFIVTVQHQKYACDKCGAAGGIFQFLLSLKDVSLEEALIEVKETCNISFDADFLDIRWNEYLQGTDYQQMLRKLAGKAATFLESGDSSQKNQIAGKQPISYTELATFIRCPLEYKLRYRDSAKMYEPAGTRVYLGRFLHSITAQFLKQTVDGRNRDFIESKFRQEIAAKSNSEYVDELLRFEAPTAMLLLENFVDKKVSVKNPHFKANFGPFSIVGTADCLVESNDGIDIVEFKEFDYREFEDEMEIVHYLQLLFYFFGLGGRESGISGGSYCFFNNGFVDHVVFTDGMINQARDYIEAKLHELTKCKGFAPRLNSLCISCGYNDNCRLRAKAKGRV